MIEEEVREHLGRLAGDTPGVEEMKARIRANLETLSAKSEAQLGSPEARTTHRWPIQVAATLLIITGAWAASNELRNSPQVRVDAVGTRIDETALRTPMSIEGTGTSVDQFPVSFDLILPSASMTIQRVTDRHVTIDLGSGAQLHIISPPSTTMQDVEDAVLASLSDTKVDDMGPSEIGGFPSQRLRLSSGLGTTQVGFQIGFSTYLVTSGIDRVHEVHIIDTSSETKEAQIVVLWLDAPTGTSDDIFRLTDDIVSTIALDT